MMKIQNKLHTTALLSAFLAVAILVTILAGAVPALAADAAPVLFKIEPSTDVAITGETITAQIVMEAGEQQVSAVDCFINLDPACFQIVRIIPDLTAFDMVLNQEIDTLNGCAGISLGKFSAPVTGTVTIATVVLECVEPRETASLTFNTEHPRKTKAAYGFGSLPLELEENAIAILENHTVEPAVLIALNPDTDIVQTGNILNIQVAVDAGEQPVNAIDCFINFDPQFLAVNDISPELAAMNCTTNCDINFTAGMIDYSAITFGEATTGTFTLLEISFLALQETEETAITLSLEAGRETRACYGGCNVLGTVENCAVIIDTMEKMIFATQEDSTQKMLIAALDTDTIIPEEEQQMVCSHKGNRNTRKSNKKDCPKEIIENIQQVEPQFIVDEPALPDMLTLLKMVAGACDPTGAADINGDGRVNVLDITALELEQAAGK